MSIIRGADKVLEFDPLFEHTEEPRVIRIEPRARNGYKYASSSALDYCHGITSVPGKHVVLVLAMSGSEYYGPNKNGDGFAEHPVYGPNSMCLIAESEVLPKHYQSFERSGNVFAHHVNKDPNKNYGRILKAFYNYEMHRVELLLEIDEAKSAGEFFLHKIEQGEYPGVSMGCRIKYDVCSICGNKAPTRKQYCNHVNNMDPNFGMNRLLSDGRRCFVWNPSPDLFDISFVWRPADQIGFVMKKVADTVYHVRSSRENGEWLAKLSEEKAAVDKLSEIDKALHGDVAAVGDARSVLALLAQFQNTPSCSLESMPTSTAAQCAHIPLQVVVNSMCSVGITPTARDMFRLICARQGAPADPVYEDLVGAMQGPLLEVFAEHPHLLDELQELPGVDLDRYRPDADLSNKLADEMPGRALFVDKFLRESVPESYGMPLGTALGLDPQKAYYADTRRPMTYVNPDTGKVYETNRHAAELADTANKKRMAVEAAGAAGLLGVAYKSMTANGKLKYLQPAALGGAGVLGYDLVKGQRVPRVLTQEGEYVPLNTEFVEKRSGVMHDAVLPLGTGALATFMLSQDGLATSDNEQLRALNSFAQQNPVLTTLGAGTLAANLRTLVRAGLTPFKKRASLMAERAQPVTLNDVIANMTSVIANLIP